MNPVASGTDDDRPVTDVADGDEAERTARLLRRRLASVIEPATDLVGRLGKARTTVAFVVEGAEESAVTLLLDRRPPTVAPAGEPAEIRIGLSVDQANAFMDGQLPLPAALLNGDVWAEGPVRAYLAVDPIVRNLLGQSARNGAS